MRREDREKFSKKPIFSKGGRLKGNWQKTSRSPKWREDVKGHLLSDKEEVETKQRLLFEEGGMIYSPPKAAKISAIPDSSGYSSLIFPGAADFKAIVGLAFVLMTRFIPT